METKYGKGWSWDDLNLTKEEKLLDEQARKELQKQFEGFDDDMGSDVSDELINIDGVAYVDSRTIALKLGKKHKHVIDTINISVDRIGEPKFRPSSFAPIESTYKTSQNKNAKCFLLPKNLFNYIVLGYEGNKKELIEFKVAYILKFEMMEELIRSMKTSIQNSEDANKLANDICNKISEYENKIKEYDKRLSNVSLFHKKQLEMSEQARLETESKLEFYKSLDNTVDSYSEGATPIVGLSEHQLRKLVHAGEQATRELVRISTMKNKRKWY